MKHGFIFFALVICSSIAAANETPCFPVSQATAKLDRFSIFRSESSARICEVQVALSAPSPVDLLARKDLRKVSTRISNEVESLHPAIRTVIYPASGFDGFSPFLVFKDAEVVIGLDHHPFYLPFENADRTIDLDYLSWENINNVDNAVQMGVQVLRQIQLAYPEQFRLRGIYAIETKNTGLKNGPYYCERPVVHGLIEFDLGPGTPLKRYYHIQAMHADFKALRECEVSPNFEDYWWAKPVLGAGPDAVLLKAQMDFVWRDPLWPELLSVISNRRGLVVDGDEQLRTGTLNSRGYAKFQIQQMSETHFGYSGNVIFLRFQ